MIERIVAMIAGIGLVIAGFIVNDFLVGSLLLLGGAAMISGNAAALISDKGA